MSSPAGTTTGGPVVSRRAVLQGTASLVATSLLPLQPSQAATEPVETPLFAPLVKAGKLPPVAERLPEVPRRLDLAALGKNTGKQGGSLRLLMGDPRDIRMMTIYGYTRLVCHDLNLDFVPDLLERIDVEDGRIFTLRLRKGHKWSDGHPFSAEDFRYWWEDVANNKRLSLSGPPLAMRVDGKVPLFEIVDPLTVRYTWEQPNAMFVPALADAQPMYICMPAHYLKQFHEKYTDKAALDATIKKVRVRDWGALHERMSRAYRPENPDLPTLEPWRNRTKPPAVEFVFERNPFYHRTDGEGRQLPYIDEVRMSIGSSALIPAKVGGGDSDLQARYLRFDNYTFLKESEKRNDQKVRLWQRTQGAYVALYPNLNCADETFRALNRDLRFRRALSLGMNRVDINKVIFFGLAREAQNTVLQESPLYQQRFAESFIQHDPKTANALLDALGLQKRGVDGVRVLPDGRKLEIVVESSGESTEETDVLELVRDDYRAIGIKLLTRSIQLDVLRKRIRAGETVMSVSSGIDNAVPTADTVPDEFAPTSDAQFQWAMWGQYVETLGTTGQPIDMPEAKRLDVLRRDWRHARSKDERRAIWDEMLAINAEQLFSIGIVTAVPQPVVVSNQLKNVPEKGLYGFEPGAFFGLYMPDTFFFANATS